MAMYYADRILRFGKAALETLHCLRRERNFRDEDDRAASVFERCPNRLQINFRLAAASDSVQQDRAGAFWRVECLRNFLQREELLRIQNKVGCCDELLACMRIADDRFFAHLRQTAFD